MPSLKWTLPGQKPQGSRLYKKISTLGRAPGNDVRIDHEGLQDFHLQFVFDGRDFNYVDVSEAEAPLLNGKKKKRARLEHHDVLNINGLELMFSLLDDAGLVQDESAEESSGTDIASLKKLVEFGERLMDTPSLPKLLDTLLDSVIELTHADKGFLVLLHGEEPEVITARNLRQESLPEGIAHLSDSIVAKVIETQKPLIVSDALRDSVFGTSESVINLKLSSVMCAPLKARGRLLGVLYVGNDRVADLFEEKSLEFLSMFAAQAALVLENAILLDQLKTDRDRLVAQLEYKRFGDIIGSCPSLLEVFRTVEKVAPTDVSVLITGETGTGKELIAHEIHRRSPRVKAPFVVVNCGAIPENLMESELFGYVRGAFTGAVSTREGKFQAAHGGTLFLDEIGELPLSLQVKLLRALQERTVVKVGDTKSERVDIRVLAATHRNLGQDIKTGSFREDLYYRLNVVNIHLPALRERGDDIVVIAKYFLDKHKAEFSSKVRGFTPHAIAAIKKYPWPGNVRELENRLKKAVVLCDRLLIGPEDLDLGVENAEPIMTLADAREDFQRKYILEVLQRNNGNRTQTARDLGVDPRTIFRYLEREPGSTDPHGEDPV